MPIPLIEFTASSGEIETYEFVEITAEFSDVPQGNPFTDVTVTGLLQREGQNPVAVYGFCDSKDGRTHRIRFLGDRPGCYVYTVTVRASNHCATWTGEFTAVPSTRKGLVRVDPQYPWHFLWEGTGEHYFWNGTTTYLLLGLTQEEQIRDVVDRLTGYQTNRMRVALSARYEGGICNEPVYPSDEFEMTLNPWPARNPDSVANPDFDLARFNVAFWQKVDRMLGYAREKDMVISLIFYLDAFKAGPCPFKDRQIMGGEDEKRYYRYAVARFAAFSNVMWDVCNEYRFMSTAATALQADPWAEAMGAYLKSVDPWKHLTSIHGHETFHFRSSAWVDFAMYQYWDTQGGYFFMHDNRLLQEQSGKIMPQVNEEYGYESSYPELPIGQYGTHHEADSRALLAFEITMTGCYQSTGERADIPGCGGWVNGRGNDQMRMLEKYQAIYTLMTSFEWWKMEPHNELVHLQTLCLAEPGRQYLVWLRHDWRRNTTLLLAPGKYHAEWCDPFSARRQEIGLIEGGELAFDHPPEGGGPWAIAIRKIDVEA